MFKFIGAAVVYGFATFGLYTWLMRSGKDDDKRQAETPSN